MSLSRVFDGAHLRATLAGGAGSHRKLIVTFDFRRKGKTDFGAPNISDGFAKHGFAQLSIRTKANDWFINPETKALEARLSDLASGFAHVHALGWSMGGFGAFRFARALGLRNLVAVSPQASLAPDRVPFEWRYAEEAERFDPALGALPAPIGPGPRGLILFDPFIPEDYAHARLLGAAFPGVRLTALPGAGHPASGLLRETGTGWRIQKAARQAPPDPGPIYAAHKAARRASPGYFDHLARALGRQRRPAAADAATAEAERLRAAAPHGDKPG